MRFSLQETASQSGLSKRMVRALEVRYSIVQSGRDRQGKLCYSKQDIARLKLFADAIASGVDIRSIAHFSNGELIEIISSLEEPHIASLNKKLNEAKQLIKDFDSSGFDKLLYDCRLELPRERLILDFIFPLIFEKRLSSSEKSFRDFELQVFLAQIIKSSHTKEYYPTLLIIADSQINKNAALACGVLLSSLDLNVSFVTCTKSTKTISSICKKIDSDGAMLVGNFDTKNINELSRHSQHYFEVLGFSAQGLIDTNFSVDQKNLSERILISVENIKRALKL